MTSNNALTITQTDFDTIKSNLKNFLRSQSRFQDFDFDGSGMSILIDTLAYNTHYMSYYLNMVANESFLDTAQLRSSVLSHAKTINYFPESKKSARTQVNIKVTPTNTESNTSTLILSRYTKLLGSDINGVNYPFVTLYSNTAAKLDGSFDLTGVNIAQGEVITLQYLMNAQNTKRRFKIPSMNCDTSTISVLVQESTSNTDIIEYLPSPAITDINGQSSVYFLEEEVDGTYTIVFGDGVLGKKPKDGNIIIVNYVDTVGELANKISSFTFSDRLGGLFADNVSVTATSATYGGSDKETIEDIRFRAPYSYVSQNRAVSKTDYETLIKKDYENIDSIAVWGGEDNDPPIYGKVFISMKTKNNYFLTNLEKEQIKDDLIRNRNVLTVTPEFVDPSYTYLLVRGDVYYDPKLTFATADQLLAFVRASILDYETDDLISFTGVFRKAKLQQYIEQSERSITGSDIRILLQKRVILTPYQSKDYTIDFGVPITKGTYNNSLTTYPQIKTLDKNKVEREVFFEEVLSVASGIAGFKIVNSGINYDTAPEVIIVGDGSGAVAKAQVAGGRITAIVMENRGTGYSRATASLNSELGSGAQLETILENRVGNLRSYYLKDTGEKVTVNDNAGTIDYVSGKITFTSLLPRDIPQNTYYPENTLTVIVPVNKEVILPLKNRIIDIDDGDPLAIQVNIAMEE